jgi:hypothetical protein
VTDQLVTAEIEKRLGALGLLDFGTPLPVTPTMLAQ